jgi:hypothetical protein
MPATRTSKKNARRGAVAVAVQSQEEGQRKAVAAPAIEEDDHDDEPATNVPARKATKPTLEARNRALEDELARMKGK